MSFFGFNSAGSAIAAFQTAENVVADNIANVNTPGASRQNAQIVQQAPVVGSPFLFANPANGAPGTMGDGVLVTQIQRVHQDSYDALFRGANSSQNYYDIEQQQLGATQSALGEPTNGINTAYNTFRAAVQQLAGNPTDTPSQNNLLTTAGNLVNTINNSGQSILTQETAVIGQASQVVTQINNIADQIAALNGQIRASKAVGNNPNTYLDQRDQLIDQLSSLISTHTDLQASGSSLITVDGKALVNDTVVYHIATPVIGNNANGKPTLVVGFINDPTPVNPTSPINAGAGSLGAYLDIYNNKLVPYKQSLDNFTSALASEANRITQGGYDGTGTSGGQLFQPIAGANPIGAGNVKIGIASASQFPIAVATTQAGTLVQALNAANNTVDTSTAVIGNATLANAPAAQINGTLSVGVDGIVQVVNYQIGGVVPAGTIDGTTIDGFINGFNGGHYGVDASFDTNSQRIVFTRDTANIDLTHRQLQQAAGGVTTPDFTLTDSNLPAGAGVAVQPAIGVPSTGMLDTLGAGLINGVNQNFTNAFGSSNSGNINTLLGFFTKSYGVPAIQTTSGPGAGGTIAAAGPATITVTGPITTFHIGDVLTLDAQPGGGAPQENVTVSNVNYLTGQISFNAANAHAAGFSITSAQTQMLQSYYSSFVAGMGVDVQTATTGNTSQTSLSGSIDKVRQGIDGINVDEETQNLIKYQNAYAAAAHVMAVLSQMLSSAVNLGSATTF